MSKKKELIPKLRFPEFVDEGEWEEKVLSKISNAIFDGTHQTPNYIENGIPFFSVENLVSGNKNKFISRKDYKIATNKNKPEKGDILITRIGKIGFSAIVEWDYEFSIYVTLACIKSSKHFNSYYLHSYFQSSAYQKEILSKSLLNAVPCKINMNELRETKVLLPNLNEQQKIACCLSSLDEMIAAQGQKLDMLKDHKKGLMQKLFPQEGEKVPKYRFKEFEKDGKWVEKELREILVEGKLGGNYESIESSDGIPLIKMGNIDRGKINLDKMQYLPLGISYNVDDVLKGGDLLFNTRNTLDLVGKVAIWSNELPFALYNSNLMRMTFNKKYIVTNSFMNYFFNTELSLNKLKSIATGTTSVAAIYTKDLLLIKISFPSQFEQEKIASCLSSLDALITAQTEKIEQLKLHKKGLMQRLFPKIND